MAFEDLITRINIFLDSLHYEQEDAFGTLEELHHELNQMKATGQPLPDDLLELEKRLEEELAKRAAQPREIIDPTNEDIRIERETWGDNGRYVATIEGIDEAAELTFTRQSPTIVSANHTDAPGGMRGTGAARALVARLVEDARQEGFEIVPRCSYIAHLRERHPEWEDVIRSA